jgi:hypothetical protein
MRRVAVAVLVLALVSVAILNVVHEDTAEYWPNKRLGLVLFAAWPFACNAGGYFVRNTGLWVSALLLAPVFLALGASGGGRDGWGEAWALNVLFVDAVAVLLLALAEGAASRKRREPESTR